MKREEVKIVAEEVKTILADAIADYEQRTGKTLQPAHIERSIIQTYAYRELLVRKGINEAFLQTFPQFATGLALDLCGEMFGCYRLHAQAARCTLRFEIKNNRRAVTIPKHTVVKVSEQLSFSTLIEGEINHLTQYVDIDAVANLTGEVGNNYAIGQIKQLVTPLGTDIEVKNITVPSGGIDTEQDDEYRKRILLAPEALTTCGSRAAYEYHARSVSPYIADVAISTPRGGIVQITVLTKNGLPSEHLLTQIQTYLSGEKLRPLCDRVWVVAPKKVPFRIRAVLTLFGDSDETQVRIRAEQSLRRYLSSRANKLGVDIVPLDIEIALKVEGVYNVYLETPELTRISATQWAICEEYTVIINAERESG